MIPTHRSFTVYRRTDHVLESAAVSGTLDVVTDKCPSHNAYVEVTIRATVDGVGTVVVDGEYDGAPVSETLTFDGSTGSFQIRQTCSRFDCLTGITPVGFDDDALIAARYVEVGGEGVQINCLLAECVEGHLERSGRAGSWQATIPGGREAADAWIAYPDYYDFTPREGDVFVDDGDSKRWEVAADPDWLGGQRPHHFEIDVNLRNATDIAVRTP